MYTTTSIVASAALVALAALGIAAAPCMARDSGAETVSVKVAYADLDLSSPAGAAAMIGRVHRAAVSICGRESDEYGHLGRRSLVQSCINDTTARAVASLDRPMVTAMASGPKKDSSIALAAR